MNTLPSPIYRAFACVVLVLSIGLSATAQARGPRDAFGFGEPVPVNAALKCHPVARGIAYIPGPRGGLVPRLDCRDPNASAVRSPAAQGLVPYGPRGTLFHG